MKVKRVLLLLRSETTMRPVVYCTNVLGCRQQNYIEIKTRKFAIQSNVKTSAICIRGIEYLTLGGK